MTNNLAELTGPALATALVLGVGAGWAFLFDAVTFVVSAFFLTRVRVREVPPPAEERRTLLAELAEGFQHVRSRSWLWVTVVVFALAVPLANAPLFVLGPTVAEDSYDSAALFGIVTTLLGAGAVAGALAGLRWRPRHPMRAALLVLAGWPASWSMFGAAAPVAIVRRPGVRHRPRVRAVRRLVEHGDGRAHPRACAFAGELLRLDGLAGPAAGRVPRRRATRRGDERRRP